MHLMIDLETLGTGTDCVVTQIGFVVFELEGVGILHANNLRPDPNEQIYSGRTITWDTFCWWMKQSNEARESMIMNAAGSMKDTLETFVNQIEILYGWKYIEGVWSHGLTFDVAIMENLFKQYSIKTPWKYNVPRDTRTIFMLVSEMEMTKPTVAHNAKADAIAQAQNVQKAYYILKGSK